MHIQFLSRILLSSLAIICSLETQALIDLTAFKEVTKHFTKGHEFYSPTLGKVALDVGLIHNLRFFGNLTPFYNKFGKREWVKDKPKDSMSLLVKILFPSMAGALTSESTIEESFGKKTHDPKIVATLLNFMKGVREIYAGKSDKAIRSRKSKVALLAKPAKAEIISTITFSDAKLASKFNSDTLNPLFLAMEGTIDEEESSLYPKYTAEQVVLAFFVYHFNTQADIWNLLANLDEKIVDKTRIPTVENKLMQDDMKAILEKKEPYDIDDVFALAMGDYWAAITPYHPRSPLLSNGNTYPFIRATNSWGTKTFADCAEMGLRHVVNLLLYDHIEKKFNLDAIEKISFASPYFANFKNFYAVQTPALANSGDITMRYYGIKWWAI